MIVAVSVAAGVVVCVLLALLAYAAHALSFAAAMQRDERDLWAQERRELLNRIQRPDVVQHAPVTDFPELEIPPDEIGLVGDIRHDPNYEYDAAFADALSNMAFPEKG